MTDLLHLDHVSKRFLIPGSKAAVNAVNDVSLSIRPGQTLALVGESGSGKTTAGRMIAGLETLSDGRITFEGSDLVAERRRRGLSLGGKIQMVFQEPAEQLDPRIPVQASIGEPLQALGLSSQERKRRIDEVMDLIALPRAFASRFPPELSAGLQQRVGIGRAIITKPQLVVLDEPTSALDPTARADIIALLNKVQRMEGAAYLFISHDLSTVRFASERVAVMYLGMVVEEGPTSDVFENPRHPYSRALLGAALLPNPRLVPNNNVRLAGEIPSPINLPKGCFLASRCPFAQDRCSQRLPPVEAVAPAHVVRCIRHAEIEPEQEGNDLYEEFQRESQRILSVGAPIQERRTDLSDARLA